MKKLAFLISLLLASYFAQAQHVCGSWNGILTIKDREISVVFNVTKLGDVYTSTMDSPSQKLKGLSTTSTTFVDSILTIRMEDSNMQYQGRWMKNNQMKGIFTQMGELYSLDLTNYQNKRDDNTKKVAKRNNKAYSCYFDTVTLDNSINQEKTKAVYYQPIKKAKLSAVVLMSDAKDRDATHHQTYQKELTELAEHLCKNGFAVIFCIDTTSAKNPTFDAINYLKSNSKINPDKISLVKFNETNIQGIFTAKNLAKLLNKEISKIDTQKVASFDEITRWLLEIA